MLMGWEYGPQKHWTRDGVRCQMPYQSEHSGRTAAHSDPSSWTHRRHPND